MNSRIPTPLPYLEHADLAQRDLLDGRVVVRLHELLDGHHVARVPGAALEHHAVGAFANLADLLVLVQQHLGSGSGRMLLGLRWGLRLACLLLLRLSLARSGGRLMQRGAEDDEPWPGRVLLARAGTGGRRRRAARRLHAARHAGQQQCTLFGRTMLLFFLLFLRPAHAENTMT